MTSTVVNAALDLAALEGWLRSSDVEVAGPLRAQLITGGRSNLTFFLEDQAGRRWVVRRPPLGSVLATAHDVRREFRVMSALAGTAVPVPRVLGVDVDAAQVDFYVMEEVPGLVLRDAATASTALAPAARARAGVALTETLAALHAVDADAVGLGRLGRGTDYLARQIAMWQGQAEQHRVADFAEADAVRDRLLAALPPQREITLVHGDYRLDNAILGDDGEVQAVLDWELCTRGDPLADLGVFLCYWTEAVDPVQPFPDPPTALPGFTDRRGLLQIYEQATGRPVERIDFYVAFAAWRLALVFEGVAGRSAAGAYGAPDAAEERRLADVARGMVHRAGVLLDGDGS
jgi:aminoglycoside phosphotransferase (APT) family kinase protein